MSKPIKFESFRFRDNRFNIAEVFEKDGEICVTIAPADSTLGFTDPAKLRALAAELNKAADALAESKRLTFGDLKPGEWFRWDSTAMTYPVCKVAPDTLFNPRYPDELHKSFDADRPVIRLRATFAEADAEEVPG